MDYSKMLSQLQKVQADAQDMENKLAETIYEGKSNGIVIKINGNEEVQEINIPEELMDDREMLQDMLLIDFNNAVEAYHKDREEKTSALTAGFKLPGM